MYMKHPNLERDELDRYFDQMSVIKQTARNPLNHRMSQAPQMPKQTDGVVVYPPEAVEQPKTFYSDSLAENHRFMDQLSPMAKDYLSVANNIIIRRSTSMGEPDQCSIVADRSPAKPFSGLVWLTDEDRKAKHDWLRFDSVSDLSNYLENAYLEKITNEMNREGEELTRKTWLVGERNEQNEGGLLFFHYCISKCNRATLDDPTMLVNCEYIVADPVRIDSKDEARNQGRTIEGNIFSGTPLVANLGTDEDPELYVLKVRETLGPNRVDLGSDMSTLVKEDPLEMDYRLKRTQIIEPNDVAIRKFGDNQYTFDQSEKLEACGNQANAHLHVCSEFDRDEELNSLIRSEVVRQEENELQLER